MKKLSSLFVALLFGIEVQAQEAARAEATFDGVWLGEVVAPNAKTQIGFAFTRGKNGLSARFSLPDMFVSDLNLGPAVIVDDTYAMQALGIHLVLRGDRLEGTFANPLLRVELHRGDELPSPTPTLVAPAAPTPAWTRLIGAKLWASPVARDGILYVGSIDGKFHALRSSDGGEEWTWTGKVSLFGEALVTDQYVCFVDDAGDCVSLNRSTGALRWRTPLLEEKPAEKNPTFNHRTAVPVLGAEEIYVGSRSGRIIALDPDTGKIRWEHNLGAPIFSAVTVDGNELLATAYDGTVVVLDRRSRKEVARVKLGGPIASAPVVAADIVLVGCRDYLLYGLRRIDLTVVWRDSFWFSWVESVPRVADGIAYIGGSDYRRISAIEPATGAARWATDVGGLTWGTPVVTEDTIFAGTSAQDPAAIKHEAGITALDRRTGAVKWRHVVPLPAGADRAGYLGSLVLADGKIIGAGYDGTIVAIPISKNSVPVAGPDLRK